MGESVWLFVAVCGCVCVYVRGSVRVYVCQLGSIIKCERKPESYTRLREDYDQRSFLPCADEGVGIEIEVSIKELIIGTL